MSEYQNEPSGDTEQFRAFARRGEAESVDGGPNIALIVTGVVAVVLVIAVVLYLAL
jgi:hypothetical protein